MCPARRDSRAWSCLQSNPAHARQLYCSALSGGSCPASFGAVLLSNVAATFQKEGAALDAIAHCLRARALQPSYSKPYSRLATLLIDLKMPEEAIKVLEAMQVSTGREPHRRWLGRQSQAPRINA